MLHFSDFPPYSPFGKRNPSTYLIKMQSMRELKRGHAIFRQHITEIQLRQVDLNPSLNKILKSDVWTMQHGFYNKINGADFFRLLEEVTPESLWLFRNKRPEILMEIMDVKFSSLTRLMINFNKIVSIEAIDRIFMPQLESICFIGNDVHSLKPIRKANLSCLEFIGIQQNRVIEPEALVELNAPTLYHLLLERKPEDQAKGQSISWICRLNSKRLQWLWVKSDSRLKQEPVVRKVQKKYPAISWAK